MPFKIGITDESPLAVLVFADMWLMSVVVMGLQVHLMVVGTCKSFSTKVALKRGCGRLGLPAIARTLSVQRDLRELGA
jgi:hypothetical protein